MKRTLMIAAAAIFGFTIFTASAAQHDQHGRMMMGMSMMQDCPMKVEGAELAVEDTTDGVALTFTTKSSGMGLGLAICADIIQSFDGRILKRCDGPPIFLLRHHQREHRVLFEVLCWPTPVAVNVHHGNVGSKKPNLPVRATNKQKSGHLRC